MKKILFVFLLFSSLTAYAGGGITHMFLAQEAIAKLPDAKLRNLLSDNIDAYLVGSYYPDSGYVNGTGYGEDSHWDAFINTFADYLKEKYSDPAVQNPKLVAFLFGCATHRVADEILHWNFYNIVAQHDFKGDYNKAHSYGDLGIDLLLTIDKTQWLSQPTTWWVPANDLVQVYHRMHKDEYTSAEIIRGNSAIYFAGYGERFIAAFAYPYLRWEMPWTSYNYYTWPEGGLQMEEQKIAEYETNLWNVLENKSQMHLSSARPRLTNGLGTDNSPSIETATSAIDSGVVTVAAKTNEDGSVELQPPVIAQISKFNSLMKQLLDKMMGW